MHLGWNVGSTIAAWAASVTSRPRALGWGAQAHPTGLRKFRAASAREAVRPPSGISGLRQGETFTDPNQLPDWMHNATMEQAMSILERFSEKERAYHQYQARQNYLREQATIQHDLAQMQQTLLAERAEKEALLAQLQALRAQLAGKT